MLETKSLTVSPNEEQSTINLMQDFGWALKSSQTIDSSESHLENNGNTIQSVTTRRNYVKLVFERDTKMENYTTIKANEDKFNKIMSEAPTY